MTPNHRYPLVLVAALALAGCASQPAQAPEPSTVAPVVGDSAADDLHTQGQERPDSEDAMALPPDHVAEQRLVHFAFDSAAIGQQEQALIARHGRYLADHPAIRVRVEGHADERGTREYNVSLGERRALAVQRLLLVTGASPEQLEMTSYGEELPAVRGSSEASYAENRRVEFNYLTGPLADAPLSYEAPRLAAMDGRSSGTQQPR